MHNFWFGMLVLMITGIGIGYIVNGFTLMCLGLIQIGYMIGYFNPDSWLALSATSVPMA